MTKVEASTLEEAYEIAANKLSCSVTELRCEVVQYPSKGLLGLFKKQAIIVATVKEPKVPENIPSDIVKVREPSMEEEAASEIIATLHEVTDGLNAQAEEHNVAEESIVENFFDADSVVEEEPFVDVSLAQSIEESLMHLFELSCFDIDVVEVDVVDNTALIFIDGEDAALLIGKEGYRYNALSYMLFNWLHTKYQLYIKLEIAEFLTSQQEMIRNYIQPVIEKVEKFGKAKTRFLDGILVQIALEQLREAFPDKYVAIKTGKSGKKFVVINEFHSKSHG
jgi:spoIIIJ-associated protein